MAAASAWLPLARWMCANCPVNPGDGIETQRRFEQHEDCRQFTGFLVRLAHGSGQGCGWGLVQGFFDHLRGDVVAAANDQLLAARLGQAASNWLNHLAISRISSGSTSWPIG